MLDLLRDQNGQINSAQIRTWLWTFAAVGGWVWFGVQQGPSLAWIGVALGAAGIDTGRYILQRGQDKKGA